MKASRRSWLGVFMVLLGALVVGAMALGRVPAPAFAQTPPGFEAPPVLRASTVLGATALKGGNYAIQDTVRSDGLMNRYHLDTDFGPLEVEGTALLRIRIAELGGIERLQAVSKTETFGEAVKRAATSPLRGARDLVLHPIDTVSGAVSGVGRWLGNITHAMVGGASEQEEGVLKTAVGFDTTKRAFAFELGVDPYSNYKPLQDELNDIAWTAFAGGLGVKVAFAAIPGPAGIAVSATGLTSSMNALLRDKSPAELKKLNADKLAAMGVPGDLAEVFLEHRKFSPTRKTFIVGDLEQMKDVQDRAELIRDSATMDDEDVALFLQRRAEMAAAYHTKIAPVARFVRLGTSAAMLTRQGTVVGAYPVDHVAWTERTARVVQALSAAADAVPGARAKELWLGGTVSPLARQKLEALGWRVTEGASDKLVP